MKKFQLSLGLLLLPLFLLAQEVEMLEPGLILQYKKDSRNVKQLIATLEHYVDRLPVAMEGYSINFYTGYDSLIWIGEAVTDFDGKAILDIPDDALQPEDEEGFILYYASFEGDDTAYPAEYEIYIQHVNLEIHLEEIDSVKTVTARVTRITDGEEVPVSNEDIYFYVPRMFSNLEIAGEFLDDNGEAYAEYPNDIPGDAEGYLEVLVKFNDHFSFGTVEKRERIQWGISIEHQVPTSYRALWSHIAPVWMIVTLSILLTGVWSHYLYVVIELIRIKRMGKKAAGNDLEQK